MLDDANTEKISTTPKLKGVVVTHASVREPNGLLSRVDEEDHDTASHKISEVSSCTHDAAEKSFKHEDYIYVSFFSVFLLTDFQNDGFPLS